MTKDNGFDQFNRYVPGGRTIRTGIELSPHTVSCDTLAQIRALPIKNRHDGLKAHCRADGGSNWEFVSDSTVTDASNICAMSPDSGSGAWLRTDTVIPMKFAISSATADAATLYTIPTGFTLEFEKFFWEVTTSFTGGTSSAIGVSSADAPHSTQGDLLGGAGGNVLADLTSAIGYTQGTIGVSYSAAPKLAVLVPTDTIRFDRIVSAFTAGDGFVHAIAHRIAG